MAPITRWVARSADSSLPRRWWLLLIVLGSLLLLGFYTVTDPGRLATTPALSGADYAGYAICHRISSHSFTLAGRQFPLCARCTGMYLGVLLTFLLLGLSGRGRRAALPPKRLLAVLLGFVAVMGVDGLNSYSHFIPNAPHLYEPQNWLRLATGMGTGLMMGAIVFPALAQTLWRDHVWRPAIGTWRELAGLVALAAIAVLLVLSNRQVLLYVLAVASAAGVVLILTALNGIVLLILLRRDAQATAWRQAAWPLAAGLALALVQIAIISIVRFSLTGTMTGFPGLS